MGQRVMGELSEMFGAVKPQRARRAIIICHSEPGEGGRVGMALAARISADTFRGSTSRMGMLQFRAYNQGVQ
jgi:hypothetical protein